jgi:hypothetical protein
VSIFLATTPLYRDEGGLVDCAGIGRDRTRPERREEWMPYAFVQDVASSWEEYQLVAAALVDPAPVGLILHVAGPTDEGVRIIDLWESEEAWHRFQAEHLQPAVAAPGGPSRPEPTFRDLHPRHVVFGAIDGGRSTD